jgi:membrane-bound lytic murein transglycosylase B
MPENVLKFAVKYDAKSNEKIDLNNNENDVIASVANYYHLRGQWQYQQPVAELAQPKFLNNQIVFSEQFKKWLYPNFVAIKRYNNSDWYAMAIYELSAAIEEGVTHRRPLKTQ